MTFMGFLLTFISGGLFGYLIAALMFICGGDK